MSEAVHPVPQLVTIHRHPGSKTAFISCNNADQKQKNWTTPVMLAKVRAAVTKNKSGSGSDSIHHALNTSFAQAAVATNYSGWAAHHSVRVPDLKTAQRVKNRLVDSLEKLGYTVVGRESITKALYASSRPGKSTNWGAALPKTESTLTLWVRDFLDLLRDNGHTYLNGPGPRDTVIQNVIVNHVFGNRPIPTLWPVKAIKNRGDIFAVCCWATGAPF